MNYTVKKYGAWLFGIVDSNGMFVKKPDGNVLTFRSKKDAADHIKTLTESVADMHKRCEKCNTLLNDGGTCPKCDDGEEDYGDELNEAIYSPDCTYVARECSYEKASEIALMAKRAMRLREHEADTLQKDLEDGLATNWVSAFEKLPDSSDVKKLFFQFAVKTNESLKESKESKTCCICKEPIKGYGNNAEPVCSGTCCDKCNMDVVIPARVKAFRNSKNEELDDDIDDTLTESYSDELAEFTHWIQEYKNGALWDAFATEFEAEEDPDIATVLNWLETFDEAAYYDYVAADTYDDEF